MSGQPSPTLYIQNIGGSLKTDDLKRTLYHLFSTHGKVIDVVVTRNPKMRGQAFVVFKDLQSATAARRREDGNAFLGKRMRIHYAEKKSHATIEEEEGSEVLYKIKLGIHEAKTPKMIVSGAEKANIDAEAAKNKRALDQDQEDEDEERPGKRTRVDEEDQEAEMEEDSDEEGPQPASAPVVEETPHHVLTVSKLPAEATSEMLTVLFQQFPGFVTVRHQGSLGTALVWYENWSSAKVARESLDGFQMAKEAVISVAYAEPNINPKSIQELSELAEIRYSNKFSVHAYISSLESLFRQAQLYKAEGQLEDAFVAAVKAAKVGLEFITRHPDYKKLDISRREAISKRSAEILDFLSSIKPILSDRYEAWLALPKEEKQRQAQSDADANDKVSTSKPVVSSRRPDHVEKRYETPDPTQGTNISNLLSPQPALVYRKPSPMFPNVQPTSSYTSSPGPSLASQSPSIPMLPPPQASTLATMPYHNPHKQLYSIILPRPADSESRLGKDQIAQGFTPSPYSRIMYPTLQGRPSQPVPVPSSSASRVEPSVALSQTTPNRAGSLRPLNLPKTLVDSFVALAMPNTDAKKETCGLLLGHYARGEFSIHCLLIPRQIGSSDTCEMIDEELIIDFQERRQLITLGWIHTHPSQSCFLSSIDLHTQAGYQMSLAEAIAIVCAPNQNPAVGTFRLTVPFGLNLISTCQKQGFHPHAPGPLYTDADAPLAGHVRMVDLKFDIVDMRVR